MNKLHVLKTWPKFFNAVRIGGKRFEIRYDDRGFCSGDGVMLAEWIPDEERYTGRTQLFRIGYICDPYELFERPIISIPRGVIVFSLDEVNLDVLPPEDEE